MPIDYRPYGPTWPGFSHFIRFVRARGRCECTGQCGLHQPNPCTRRCTEQHGKPATWAHGKIILTTAHTCQCTPPCTIPEHVIAACQRCHLRIDRHKHAATRAARARGTIPEASKYDQSPKTPSTALATPQPMASPDKTIT